MPKAALYTLGCRLNQAETAILAGNLAGNGFEIVEFGEAVDLTVINTCTVTEQADAKCRQAVRQSVKNSPDSFVTVIGCYAQMAVETISKIDGVDMIIGNEHKMQLADFLEEHLHKQSQPTIIHSPKISRDEFIIDSVGLYDTHTRANLKIQDGCNLACSFCLTVKARGPARSRKFEDILKEANALAELNYKEIVLTGVNIGAYQQDGKRLIDVLVALEKMKGIERLRISSIEPTTVHRDLIDLMADSDKICHHLHIPLQSGDDKILEQMRRKHNAAQYRKIVEYAAQMMPDIGLGTDIMVGFPGESEEQFINTKKLLVDLPVSYFHVFTYSDRAGTTSYKMNPKVDHHLRKKRHKILNEVGERKRLAFYESFLGKELNVLFEQRQSGWWEGFSGNYMRIAAQAVEDLKNQIRTVRLIGITDDKILGKII